MTADLFTYTVPGERHESPSRFHSRHHRQMGGQAFRMDVDALLCYNHRVWAVLEEKLHAERTSGFQLARLAEIAAAIDVPLFLVHAWPERLEWTWAAKNERARDWLTSLPPELLTRAKRTGDGYVVVVGCDEARHVRLHGLIRQMDAPAIAACADRVRGELLLQERGREPIEYDLAAFAQRPVAYPDPVAAWEMSKQQLAPPAPITIAPKPRLSEQQREELRALTFTGSIAAAYLTRLQERTQSLERARLGVLLPFATTAQRARLQQLRAAS